MSSLFNLIQVTELPPVGKELLTQLITCNFIVREDMLSIFPSDVWDKLWLLIQPVPEVSVY